MVRLGVNWAIFNFVGLQVSGFHTEVHSRGTWKLMCSKGRPQTLTPKTGEGWGDGLGVSRVNENQLLADVCFYSYHCSGFLFYAMASQRALPLEAA